MTSRIFLAGVVVIVVATGAASRAQRRSATGQSAIVGAWEGQMTVMVDGHTVENGSVCHVIYAADGHFSRLCVPPGRQKLATAPDKTTTEVWSDLIRKKVGDSRQDVIAAADFGTYAVSGEKLTRNTIAALIPNSEGRSVTLAWRIEGDELAIETADHQATRYRRTK